MSFFLAPPSKNPILASSTAAPARPGARAGDAEYPIRSLVSMRKAHFMDKHPTRSSVSMRKAHLMDEHPIRRSASMRKAHFMDERR